MQLVRKVWIGCLISPFLFSLTTEYVLQNVYFGLSDHRVELFSRDLFNLEYVTHISLLGDDARAVQHTLDRQCIVPLTCQVPLQDWQELMVVNRSNYLGNLITSVRRYWGRGRIMNRKSDQLAAPPWHLAFFQGKGVQCHSSWCSSLRLRDLASALRMPGDFYIQSAISPKHCATRLGRSAEQ